jgi:hypothetical protein
LGINRAPQYGRMVLSANLGVVDFSQHAGGFSHYADGAYGLRRREVHCIELADDAGLTLDKFDIGFGCSDMLFRALWEAGNRPSGPDHRSTIPAPHQGHLKKRRIP